MGRPPSNGAPAFRFSPNEIAEMEAILNGVNNTVPARDMICSLAEKFSSSAERAGKIVVQSKQVWNWFQNRRYAQRAKQVKPPAKLNVTPMPRVESHPFRNVAPSVPTPTDPTPAGKSFLENPQLEFEAKSVRDGAWYDVASFLSHRMFETGDPEVRVRFTGFGVEEDEWINVRKYVRPRSLPCEAGECIIVLPGDLVLCFQEGKEQALYFDAHVLDAQRRRHDVRGCRCRFLVRYDHDQSEEIVPLRKMCRRPETDYRLQILKTQGPADVWVPSNDLSPVGSSKDANIGSSQKPPKQRKLMDVNTDEVTTDAPKQRKLMDVNTDEVTMLTYEVTTDVPKQRKLMDVNTDEVTMLTDEVTTDAPKQRELMDVNTDEVTTDAGDGDAGDS